MLLTPGPVFTYRSFKQSASKKYRGLLSNEFNDIVKEFIEENVGEVVVVRPNGSNKDSKIFKKKTFQELPSYVRNIVTENQYSMKLNSKPPKSITPSMLELIFPN